MAALSPVDQFNICVSRISWSERFLLRILIFKSQICSPNKQAPTVRSRPMVDQSETSSRGGFSHSNSLHLLHSSWGEVAVVENWQEWESMCFHSSLKHQQPIFISMSGKSQLKNPQYEYISTCILKSTLPNYRRWEVYVYLYKSNSTCWFLEAHITYIPCL